MSGQLLVGSLLPLNSKMKPIGLEVIDRLC
jgi:hypothetical protein